MKPVAEGASWRRKAAAAASYTASGLLVSAALLLLLLDTGTSAQASSDQIGKAQLSARGHAGHGAAPGTSMAAAMIGEEVNAPGTEDSTEQFLNLPPAQPYRPGRVREFTLIAGEHEVEIAKGLNFPAWTFSEPGDVATVPAPTLRVTEGDLVRITLKNQSTQPHSIHTHGIHPSDQDGVMDMVDPGEEFTYEFIAGPAGVQPYHCHAMPLKKHLNRGMYGMIIIDPKTPPPPADREMSMLMNGFDTNMDDTNEVYTVNGMAFHYAKYPIKVKRGELVRIYLVNMTENDPINSFHLHANFFNYWPIGFSNPKQYTDIVSQIQGDRGIIEVRFPEAGPFMFHAHQTEFADLGWMGFFEVSE